MITEGAVASAETATDGDADGTLGAFGRVMELLRANLPRGNTLDDESFGSRHRFLCWVLGLHVPVLAAFGVARGFGLAHSTIEVALPAACLALARLARDRRLAAFFVTAGLVACSTILVHFSGGTIEAHFHYFVVTALIAMYQDWVPFASNVAFVVVSHGAGSALASDLMFNHAAAQARPWAWTAIHASAVLAACVVQVVSWRHTEVEQERSTKLAGDLATMRSEVTQRRSVSELFLNLARRNQSLLERQLALIAELEERERAPHDLADLFRLEHLATRIRRNAESLLVLSGDEPPRRWGRPVPLAEVVQAAAAEVEDFRRVEVLVDERLQLAGRAVADVAHLLAELIENATTFSPPTTRVRVRNHVAPSPETGVVLTIADAGIGMAPDELQRANALLAEPQEIDLKRSSTLGFHVVSRLALRYAIGVRLADTPGGGITALVTLPEALVTQMLTDQPLAALPAGPPVSVATVSPATVHGLARRPTGGLLDTAAPTAPGHPAAAGPMLPGQQPVRRDRERIRSMLSQFQANQRAARAAAREHRAVTPEEGR